MATKTWLKRLDRLTHEQEALLPVIRDEWLRIGLSTEPADRPAAEAAARLAYVKAELPEPRFVVWLRSPLEGVVAAAMMPDLMKRLSHRGGQVRGQVRGQVWGQVGDQVGDQVGGQVRDQVWDQVRGQVWGQVGDQVGDQVRDQVWDQVRGQVGDQVWDQVRDQVRGQVGDQVGDQVRDQVWGQVRGQVGDQVGDQVRDQVWDQVGDQVGDQVRGQVGGQVRGQVGGQVRWSIWGQHDAGWLSWMDAFRRLGIDTSLGDGLIGVGRNAGWWWALQDAVILTERPLALHRDERGRLHCEDGPAIVYPDGWGVWAWHGVRIARELIEKPETITVKAIDAERNAEVARVMVERYGLGRFLQDGGAIEVARDDWGTLWRRSVAGEDLVLVEVINSTPEPDGSTKTYFLRVPPAFGAPNKRVPVAFNDNGADDVRTVDRTPHAAIAWTFGLTPAEYRPTVMS